MAQIPYKIYLDESELPKAWYNLRADMKNKPAPLLNPATLKPMTFEELQALFDSRNIILREQEETKWNQATYYGRIFARSGGLAEAVTQALKELDVQDFEFNPIACSGIEECKKALMKANRGVLPNNFIEGMACVGGCVGGSGNMIRYQDAPEEFEDHTEEASAVEILKNVKKTINIL